MTVQVVRDTSGKRTVTSPSGHSAPEDFLRSLREKFALLDYRTFAGFIEDSPLDRGRTFSALLGLSDYSDRRQVLQAASDTKAINNDLDIKLLGNTIAAAQRDAQQALVTLRETYEAITGKPLTDTEKLDEYGQEVAQALGNVELLKDAAFGKTLDEIDVEALKREIRKAEGGEQRQELESVVAKIVKLNTLLGCDFDAIDKEQAQLKALLGERDKILEKTRGELMKGLYDAAHALLEGGAWSNELECPLCESDLGTPIGETVDRQRAQYDEASEKINTLGSTWSNSSWRTAVSAIESSEALNIDGNDREYSDRDAVFKQGKYSMSSLEEAVSWSTKLVARARAELTTTTDRKAALEKELPASLVQLTEQVEYARSFKEALALYRDKQETEVAAQTSLNLREEWRNFISSAAGVFSEAEAELSREKITEIETQYKDMFAEVMNVSDVIPSLLRESDKQDLHVQLSDFDGQHKLSARALLSESYRNALAITVFLAAAMKHSGPPRFVVLDDVTSSFDAGHQYMLMELIRTKLQCPAASDNLQFIVLSHDGLLESILNASGATPGGTTTSSRALRPWAR